MISKINYIPQLVPILKRKKEIEKQVQENRQKQKELQKQEKELIMQEAIIDVFIKNPQEFKKFNKGNKS